MTKNKLIIIKVGKPQRIGMSYFALHMSKYFVEEPQSDNNGITKKEI